MTLFTNRMAFMAPIADLDACNRALNALGSNGDNFALSAGLTSGGPVTHKAGSAVQTDDFIAKLDAAPGWPDGVPWPDSLELTDWAVVASAFTYVVGPASSTSPLDQFLGMLGDANLVWIT